MSFVFQSRLPRYGAKICGIKTPADYDHCVSAGAAFIGCVFFEKSPRHLSWGQASRLAEIAYPNGPIRVALTVNADDNYIEQIIEHFAPDMIQLHGDETPERSAEIKSRFDIAVMKAFRVKSEQDIQLSTQYHDAVDWLLFDADSGNPDMPGGTGHQFDWSLASHLSPPLPWMLAGGLSAQNIHLAKAQTSAQFFDVSSAVESEKGVKDHDKITQFIETVKIT